MAKILMVDDNPDFLEAAKIVLESQGHMVLMATNARAGEDAVKEEGPDLILLDIMMEQPDDGIALAKELRKDGIEIPIVMLSNVSKETGDKCGEDSEVQLYNDFLQKPVKPQDLINTVDSLLKI